MAFVPFVETDLPSMANFNEKLLEAIAEAKAQALDEGVKIETGSYVGTGTYGEGNPNSLTFEFVPTLVMVYDASSPNIKTELINGNPVATSTQSGASNGVAIWSDKTVEWYNNRSEGYQMNYAGSEYIYIAIG